MKTMPVKLLKSTVKILCIICICALPAWSWDNDAATPPRYGVNINTASAKELKTLPFIGKARARAIISFRQRHGSFKNVTDLLKCDAIGARTFDAIKPYLKLSGKTHIPDDGGFATSPCPPLPIKPDQVVLLNDKTYFPKLIRSIKNAEKEICITMFLFKTTSSPRNRANLIIDNLAKAKKRGVKISVILEKSGYDKRLTAENMKTAKKLKKHRIKVRFDGPDVTTHSKLVIIDRRYVFLGSHNFTHSALFYNHEVSVFMDSRDIAEKLLRYIGKI